MRKKRTEIMIETTRVFVRSRATHQLRGCCAQCGGQGRMLTIDDAATVAGLKPRAVYRRIEAAEIHFTETPDGQLLVCLDSLLRST